MQIENVSQIEIQQQQLQQVAYPSGINLYSPEKIKSRLEKQYRKFQDQNHNKSALKRLCQAFLAILITFKLVLQQLWCQLVPIFIRGRQPGELKNIQRHKNAYFGSTNNLLYKLQLENYFFLIIYENQSQPQKDLYEVMDRQHIPIIINTKTLFIRHNSNSYRELGFQKPKKGVAPTKLPLLYICKNNIAKELVSFAAIQLKNLSAEDLSFLVREVERQIQEYSQFQHQVKQKVQNQNFNLRKQNLAFAADL